MKSELKKGPWSPEEDRKLKAYISRYGIWNWTQMPKFAGLLRSGKSCRLRWRNYLRPDIKHGDFTEEDDETIVKLHQELGNRWSKIAASLPGRTDNDIKNHWHCRLKKRAIIKNNNGLLQEAEDEANQLPGLSSSSDTDGCDYSRVLMKTPISLHDDQCIADCVFPSSSSNDNDDGSTVIVSSDAQDNIFSETYPSVWELPFTDPVSLLWTDELAVSPYHLDDDLWS